MAQPLTDFYKNYYSGKSTKKKLFKILFFLVILIFVVCLVVSIISLKAPTKDYEEHVFYFVHAGEYSSASKASQVSEKVSSLGGAGVNYNIGNTIFVVVSAYNLKEDALKVKKQILSTFPNAGVLKVNTKKLSKIARRSVHNNSPCKNYYISLHNFINEIATLGANFDTGNAPISKVYKNIMLTKSNITSYSSALSECKDNYQSTMYASSLVVLEHIKSFFSSAFVSSNPSRYIKKLHINMIVEFIDMTHLI